MKKIKTTILSLALVLGLVAVPLMPVAVHAQADKVTEGVTSIGGKGSGPGELNNYIKTIVNVLLFVLGIIAVIMIVLGGVKYTTSNGDAGTIKSAKDTILYAVVGLVVAILAFAIVNFVVGAFTAK